MISGHYGGDGQKGAEGTYFLANSHHHRMWIKIIILGVKGQPGGQGGYGEPGIYKNANLVKYEI